MLEETHYYPFGLKMDGICSKAVGVLQNKIGITGKELQSKEFSDGSGLEEYDFGARFYDSKIGRWTTIDPKADKFEGLSPYVYTANNPVLLVDFDGKDWTITFTKDANGNAVFNITFTAQVLNSSNNKNINTTALATQIKTQFETIFNVKYGKDAEGIPTTINAIANVSVINKRGDLAGNATLYDIVDGSDNRIQTNNPNEVVLGRAINGKEILLNADNVPNIINGSDKLTTTHEAGHTAGLLHPNQDFYTSFFGIFKSPGFTSNAPPSNFMMPVWQATNTGPTKHQVYRIYQLYSKGKLNKKEGTRPIEAEW